MLHELALFEQTLQVMIDCVQELQRRATDGTPHREMTPDPNLESSVDFFALVQHIATVTENDISPDDFVAPS